ncbi:hypothetical protein Tco_0488819 [Tanacetum coccineum]
MASLDHRLNPLFSIKECMTCRALHTRSCGCSKGSFGDKILVPCLNEGWYTIHDENEILNTYEPYDDNTNVVSTPREPFVFNQDPGVKSSQSPPQINHNCCYKCGDSLDDIFCQRCTCKSCGNGAHIGYNCPPNPEQCNQTIVELPQTLPSVHPTCNSGDENSFTYDSKPNFANDSPNNIEYVDATPPNSELVSLEEVEDVILRDKLSNVYLLISKIESLNDNPTLSSFSDNSFSDHKDEMRQNGSYTTHANNLSSEYDRLFLRFETYQGGLTSIVIFDNNLLLEIPEFESFHFDLDPSFPRPPPEPPDVEINLVIKTDATEINNFDELNEDECFDPEGDEIDVENDDSFIFVIRELFSSVSHLPYGFPSFAPSKNRIPFLTPRHLHLEPVFFSCGMELFMYGYCKNLKKAVKTGQSRTRERKSTQRARRMLSKVNSGQPLKDKT